MEEGKELALRVFITGGTGFIGSAIVQMMKLDRIRSLQWSGEKELGERCPLRYSGESRSLAFMSGYERGQGKKLSDTELAHQAVGHASNEYIACSCAIGQRVINA